MEIFEEDKKIYEISFLVKTEEEISSVVDFVKQHDAEIVTEPSAKNIALAYEIKKNKEAVFVYFKFKSLPENAKLMEKDLSMNNLVIRSLIIIAPKEGRVRVEQKKEASTDTKKAKTVMSEHIQVKQQNSVLSNEALEKKIEEILK